MSKLAGDETFDLEDRDPQHLNGHLQVQWEDVVGEPHLIRSPECAWTLSRYCFKFARLGVYTFLAVLCAPLASCCMGTTYALYHFQHIWCATPGLRLCRICCGMSRSFVRACAQGVVVPIVEALGRILSQIRTRSGPIAEPDDDHSTDKDQLLIV